MPCPPGDPGRKTHTALEARVIRGDDSDTIEIDWAATVWRPELITYVMIGNTKLPNFASPQKYSFGDTRCYKTRLTIKLALTVASTRGLITALPLRL